MTLASTTIRVSLEQRERLRQLAEERDASMSDTFDAALECLRREQFYASMATAEQVLRADPDAWRHYTQQRDQWLDADTVAQ